MDVATSFFSGQEVAALNTLPASAQREGVFDLWTLKESYIKAVGKGLSIPMDKVGFFFPDHQTIEVSFHPDLCETASRWRFWQVRPTNEYLIAVCAQRLQASTQTLVFRKIIPLRHEELLGYDILRRSIE
jgi:4'-phosphopantetheinyl transferase